eukprot:scaffold38540_cov20-Tisochrysis_lutea.AAC.2
MQPLPRKQEHTIKQKLWHGIDQRTAWTGCTLMKGQALFSALHCISSAHTTMCLLLEQQCYPSHKNSIEAFNCALIKGLLRSIPPLSLHFQVHSWSRHASMQSLQSSGRHSLHAWSSCAHLDHQEVLLDDAVVGEAAHGGDVLLGDIEVSGRAVARVTLLAQLVHLRKGGSHRLRAESNVHLLRAHTHIRTHPIRPHQAPASLGKVQEASLACACGTYLLVDLRAVMEALLTGAGHSPAHTGRVPCTNAGHLAQTTVGLAWQAGHTPALNHTLHSMTTGNGDGVDHLVGLHAHMRGKPYVSASHTQCRGGMQSPAHH